MCLLYKVLNSCTLRLIENTTKNFNVLFHFPTTYFPIVLVEYYKAKNGTLLKANLSYHHVADPV